MASEPRAASEVRYAARCKVCRTPIRGIAALPYRLRGVGPYAKNPSLCDRCSHATFPAEEREISVLFADVRGFTALSETGSLAQLRGSLNRLFGAASQVLLRHDALVDKFLGDAVMALFNAPISDPDHRRSALQAAIEIHEAARTLGLPFAIGIGLNSGVAITGNVGAGEVTDYSAIGDAVNVASRLSGLAGPGEILAAAATCEGLLDAISPTYTTRVERLTVKGRSEPVGAYRIAPVN